MIYFEIVVDNINELKNTEMYLFNLNLPEKVSGNIYVKENHETFSYMSEKVDDGKYTLVTY